MSTHEQFEAEIEKIKNLPEEEKRKLDKRAHNGEVVVPRGTGGKSLEAQIHLAEGKNVFGRLKRSAQMVYHVHEAMRVWILRRRIL
jgi:RecA-family ATPase